MNSEEIANKDNLIRKICRLHCECENQCSECTPSIEGSSYTDIADWHISEIAAAEKRGERRGRREVANIAFDLVYQEDRENQEVIDYLQEIITANSDHTAGVS